MRIIGNKKLARRLRAIAESIEKMATLIERDRPYVTPLGATKFFALFTKAIVELHVIQAACGRKCFGLDTQDELRLNDEDIPW